MARPEYGDSFKFNRVLRTFFYTSNTDKLLQARLVFSRYGQSLYHFRGQKEPYDEDETLGTTALLSKAVLQVTAQFGMRSIFFVEDTSLRIEALSEHADYPGLSVKHWFSAISFEELDRQIALRGGSRHAVIKSDIALHLPTLSRPIFFHGEVGGTVASSPPQFEASLQYPWLTPSTFNGWFVPDGSRKRLGEMEFEESLDFDFRARALVALIVRLEELNASLNLTPSLYMVRRPSTQDLSQLWLPGSVPQILIVIGHKCSGKTTLSDHLTKREDVHAFEASTVLRDIAREAGREIKSSSDALQFLRERGLDIVAKRLADYMERIGPGLRIVTGLRTPEELLAMRRRFPYSKILLVESDSRVRFERHIKRARDTDIKTYRDFLAQDEEQCQFGIMRVASDLADNVIHNNATIDKYLLRIDDLVATLPFQTRLAVKDGELYRCLRALRALGRVATCEEISEKTQELGNPVRRYNTNRALKSVPEFAERVEKRDRKLSYRLRDRGRELLSLMTLLVENDSGSENPGSRSV